MAQGRCGIVFVALLLLGCGESAVPFQPATGRDAARLYWGLTLNHHAATLSTVAPYDTIRLVATPRDDDGNPIPGLGPITFSSSDSEHVVVTPDGLVRAINAGGPITVTAELAIGNTQHTDQVIFNVTNDSAPPVLAHLSIHPSDSTTWALTGDGAYLSIAGDGSANNIFPWKFVNAIGTDANGNPIPDLAVEFASSDTTVAQALGTGGPLLILSPSKPGRTIITASATMYGVTAVDTVQFTITMPAFNVVKIAPRQAALGTTVLGFNPDEVTDRPEATVVWVNVGGQPVDIVFDDPTNIVDHGAVSCAAAGNPDSGGTGNIAAFGVPQDPQANLNAENCRSRRFPVPGVYPYHSARTGATGRVIVTDGLAAH